MTQIIDPLLLDNRSVNKVSHKLLKIKNVQSTFCTCKYNTCVQLIST